MTDIEMHDAKLGLAFTESATGVDALLIKADPVDGNQVVARISYTLTQAAEVASLLLGALGGKAQDNPSLCSVDDCDRLEHSRSLCKQHYNHQHRHGHPTEKRPR